jgi:hypothetical protein
MGADPKTIQVAIINTFGAPRANIPARDTIGPIPAQKAAAIKRAAVDYVLAVHEGRDPQPILQRLANELGATLKGNIIAFSTPPNAPSTEAQKGFNNPLIGPGADGGRLLAQASARVRRL